MAAVTQVVGTRTSLAYTGSGLSTLASATYVKNTTAYPAHTAAPLDVVIDVVLATTNTPSGNKQALVFVQESLDGSNYRTGPTSGTTTTREGNLKYLGSIPVTTASTTEEATFSLVQILGYVPYDFFVVIKNDLGVALTSGTVFTSEISSTVA